MYEVILKSCARVCDLETALTVRRSMQHRGIAKYFFLSLTKCAAKQDEWNNVLDVIASAQNEGFAISIDAYTTMLCESAKRSWWSTAVDLYATMSDSTRSKLTGWSLRTVIVGHAKSDNKELQRRAVEIFNEHKEVCDTVEYKTILKGLLGVEKDSSQEASGGLMGILSSFFKR